MPFTVPGPALRALFTSCAHPVNRLAETASTETAGARHRGLTPYPENVLVMTTMTAWRKRGGGGGGGAGGAGGGGGGAGGGGGPGGPRGGGGGAAGGRGR